MKANKFIQAHGLKCVKDIISKYSEYTHVTDDARMFINENKTTDFIKSQLNDVVKIYDLKRLVESWELVGSLGGLVKAKKKLRLMRCEVNISTYRQAIADVESCL